MSSATLLPDDFDYKKQLGESLIVKIGTSAILQPVEKCLDGKTVLLYFGAAW